MLSVCFVHPCIHSDMEFSHTTETITCLAGHISSSDLLVSIFSNLELYREFAEEAYSIALHPSGLYILVGFSDKLRLMNLLIDDIRTFKEFTIRGCREVNLNIDLYNFLCILSVQKPKIV